MEAIAGILRQPFPESQGNLERLIHLLYSYHPVWHDRVGGSGNLFCPRYKPGAAGPI
jgi:hypothetical protein